MYSKDLICCLTIVNDLVAYVCSDQKGSCSNHVGIIGVTYCLKREEGKENFKREEGKNEISSGEGKIKFE